MAYLIKFRRSARLNWLEINPILAVGEPGFETDTNKFKIGNGYSRWADLEYVASGAVGEQGPPGEDGAQGIQGPPGADGAQGIPGEGVDVYYIHTQAVPASIWIVDHPFSRHPNALVVDTAGTQVIGEVTYPTVNRVILTFTAAFSGTAYLS